MRSRVRRRIATVESPKVPRGGYAHQQDACTSGDDLIRSVEIEISDASDEEVSEDEVRKSPKDVDGRRGKALAWRLGEGTLKGPSHHAADEVRNGIGEESAAEQVGYVVKPVHDWALHIRSITAKILQDWRRGEIRGALRHTGIQDPRNRPLCHPSVFVSLTSAAAARRGCAAHPRRGYPRSHAWLPRE